MSDRLVDRFQRGDRVEIAREEEEWMAGQIARLEHPGVWVKTIDGRFWFVTNNRRIRPAPEDVAPDDET